MPEDEEKETEWPKDIIELAGAWGDDFPSLEELRVNSDKDVPREDELLENTE